MWLAVFASDEGACDGCADVESEDPSPAGLCEGDAEEASVGADVDGDVGVGAVALDEGVGSWVNHR